MVKVVVEIPEEKYIIAKMLCKVVGHESVADLCLDSVNTLCKAFEEAVEEHKKGE